MRAILNLTQHAPTQEQVLQGVYDPEEHIAMELKGLLNFEFRPEEWLIRSRALDIATWAAENQPKPEAAMIGGAPFLMGALEKALWDVGITPMYSFTTRVVEEVTKEDGTVEKRSVFKHRGWVTPPR